jgi:hypothetical protein
MPAGTQEQFMNRILAMTIVSAVVISCAVSQPASARDDGAVAAGVLGGLAAGAIIGSQAQRNYYSGPGYVQEPVYDQRDMYRECHIERQQVVDSYGYVRTRRFQVCD